MIRAENLSQTYGAFTALQGVSFEIPKGQVVGLVGPNGAGKTTTMKILTGYLVPSAGRASVFGHDIVQERIAAQRHLGYLPESAPVYRDLLVQEYLQLMAKLREVVPADRRRRISAVVAACSLKDVLTKPIGHLSKGFRQRVGIAQAMVHDPALLILDEPTSGLDPTQILDIREVIRRMGQEKTVILSTHILSEVEATCDRALMIVAGRLHVDEPMESFRRGKAIIVRLLGSPAGAADRLAKVEGVSSIETIADRDGNSAFRLHSDGREGLLTSVAKLAQTAGWTPIELAREHHDLEEIFRRLKANEEAAA